MRARLFAKTGELAGLSFEIERETTLGRADDNRIVLPSALVSAHHARITWDSELASFVIEDLGSRNGTFLGDRPIQGAERLERLEVISFAGQLDFIFQVPTQDPPALPPPPAPPSAEPPSDGTFLGVEAAPLPAALFAEAVAVGGVGEHTRLAPLEAWRLPELAPPEPVSPVPLRFRLEVERGEGVTALFALSPGEHVVGRADDCEVTISDPALSRHHCQLIVTAIEVRAADLGSTNRTFLAGEPISGEVVVPPGVELRFGSVPARVTIQAGDAP